MEIGVRTVAAGRLLLVLGFQASVCSYEVNPLRRQVAIVASREDWHVDALHRALTDRGCSVAVVPVTALMARVGGTPLVACGQVILDEMDAVLVRGLPGGSVEQIIFRMDVLQILERRGVPVYNSPRAIERTVDKYLTSVLLAEAGIPTPATVVAQGFGDAMAAFASFGDVVAKPLFGSGGRGIVRISDPDTAYRVFRAWEAIGAVFYVQQFIAHGNRDVRAFVVGERVVAAIERVGEDWKTNVARGARPRPIELPAEWARLAVEAAQVVGASYAGVDLLPAGGDAVYVAEVNGIPGWSGLQAATGLDIAGLLADYVLAQLRG